MTSTADTFRPSPFPTDARSNIHTSIPILPSSTAAQHMSTQGDPMDTTPTKMGPPSNSSPSGERNGTNQDSSGDNESSANTNGNVAPAAGAAAAAQQPKVVQTAFIHKLYNMLEDKNIQHLISWSSSGESFLMSPSSEFSKVLSSYFKHTNISSFVRQLNMYGFHKVSDVFQTGSPDSPMWEFKHGNGNFKRGDLVGLREIKRRASRHALIHRDSFSSGPKVSVNPPGTPADPMPDPSDTRMAVLEHYVNDVNSRMHRFEDSYSYVNHKCQVLAENLHRSFQWNIDLTNVLLAMVPDPESAVHRDVTILQREIARQTETLRVLEEQQEPPHSARQAYFANLADHSAPVSPRQHAADDSRRTSIFSAGRPPTLRPPAPAVHLSITPRRYGSIGGAYSPGRHPGGAPPPSQHHPPNLPPPPAPSSSYNVGRRHTSADIRLHGWQPHLQGAAAGPPPGPGPLPATAHSPYASGASSSQWPSSPHRTPIGLPASHTAGAGGDQQLRDALASYEIRPSLSGPAGGPGPAPHVVAPPSSSSRQPSPPPAAGGGGVDPGWALPAARYPFKGLEAAAPPPTRRSSMASNVHSLLNPAETAERSEEPEDGGVGEERKRKRLL